MQVGDVIGGRYRIERMLGMGGFGVVAAATHLELRSAVALKMIRPELADDDEIVDRFLREARAVAGLQTDHVCRVFDIGRTEQGTPYIVMELLQGSDVAAMLRTQPLPQATAVDFVLQACSALAEAHARGIVHRDLKPANLFIARRPDGTSLAKVLDFGIAKAVDELRLTHSSVVLGSPQYMSPEQLTTPKDVDARTDIWSVGVTLYHMLARRLPFPSAQMGELAVMITSQPPAPIDIDPGLRTVLWRCLEKDRAARFADVNQLAAALAPYALRTAPVHAAGPPAAPPAPMPNVRTLSTAASVAMHAPAPPPPPATAPVPTRSRAVLLGILAVSVIGVGGMLAYLVSSRTAEPPATPAKPTPPIVMTPSVDASPSIDAARVAAPPADAPSVDAAPRRTAPRVDAALAAAPSSSMELELAKLEGRIGATPKIAPEYPSLMMSATQLACIVGDRAKARQYFAEIADAAKRKQAADACRAYHIEL